MFAEKVGVHTIIPTDLSRSKIVQQKTRNDLYNFFQSFWLTDDIVKSDNFFQMTTVNGLFGVALSEPVAIKSLVF